MYLIEIQTLQLREFIGDQVPPYAILSHRWGTGELTFKDVLKNRADKSSRGYRKMLGACQAAKSYEVEYVWIDTCCIDKKSSAELSEAINSMFSWYANAKVCLTYLEDVNSLGQDLEQSFKNSKWFERAWTLQELLAPQQLDFYDCQWIRIGSRRDVAKLTHAVTRIPISAMNLHSSHRSFQTWSIAERMSWAAGRQATRTEDIAYSLMGLFDVNMPLLYGEGSKAFIRLQEEIIRSSTTDLSILCWGSRREKHQLLARHPNDFQHPDDGLRYMSREHIYYRLDTALYLTSLGLSIKVRLYRWQQLNSYVVLVSEPLSIDRPLGRFLLLQQHSGWDRVHATGSVEGEEITMRHAGLHRLKTLTLQRDPLDADNIAQIWTPGNGFFINANGTSSSISVDPETANLWHELAAKIHWETINEGNRSYTFCEFSTAMYPGVARFHIDCADATLWFNAYFDFDSRPCVYIGLEPIVMKSPSDLPDHDANLVPIIRNGFGPYPVQELEDGLHMGHFFFSAPLDMFYVRKLPAVIPPMWINLHPPSERSTKGKYWHLSFSGEGVQTPWPE